MPAIEFRSPETTPAIVPGDHMPEGPLRDKFSDGDLNNEVRMYHPGGPDTIQMIEMKVHPNDGPYPHAHAEDEILYVLEGEVHIGRRVLDAGSSVFIPAYTVYQFHAGPNGARILNTRPRADTTYITREELVAMRRDGPDPR